MGMNTETFSQKNGKVYAGIPTKIASVNMKPFCTTVFFTDRRSASAFVQSIRSSAVCVPALFSRSQYLRGNYLTERPRTGRDGSTRTHLFPFRSALEGGQRSGHPRGAAQAAFGSSAAATSWSQREPEETKFALMPHGIFFSFRSLCKPLTSIDTFHGHER